jgi:ABC-type branched-subunit amino acid transport system substrate-binding protein
MKKLLVALLVTLTLVLALAAPNVQAHTTTNEAPEAVLQTGDRTECEEDLSGETITFWAIGDLSGAYAFITQPLLAGLNDAAAYYNERGGACGADIEIEIRDTGGNADRTQEFWDEVTSMDELPEAVFLFASADAELLRDQAVDLQIPILLAAGSELALYGESGDEPAYTFAIIPLYTDQLGNFCDYVSDEENRAALGLEGDPVIGHLSWEGAFGRSSDTEETRAYCESVGVGYAGAEYFLPTTSDVSTQLQSLVEAGANIIYTTSLASGPANVAAAVASADLQGEVLLAGSNWALDTSVIGLGGADTAGIVGSLPYLWWDETDNEGVLAINAAWATERFAPAGDDPDAQRAALATRNIAYLLSFPVVDAYIEILTRALNEVGYDNLNGQAVYEVLNGGFEYAGSGGIINFAYDEETRSITTSRIGQIAFVEVEGGVNPTVLPLNDFREIPDLRVGGEDTVE